MKANLLIFSIFIFLSFCLPQTPPMKDTSRATKDAQERGEKLTSEQSTYMGSNSKTQTGGPTGTAGTTAWKQTGTNSAGLYDRNADSDDPAGYAGTVTTSMNITGVADCSIHKNRQKGDPCSYDFCGNDAANAHLNSEDFRTSRAVLEYLKKQNKFPSPCTNEQVIKVLKDLKTLDLSSMNLSDISILSFMKSLVDLNLDRNNLTDLSVLFNITTLEVLKASFNKLTNLTGVLSSQNLREIYVTDNMITTVDDLADLQKLTTLDIMNNRVKSITRLKDKKMGIAVTGNPGIITEIQIIPPNTTIYGNSCFSGGGTNSFQSSLNGTNPAVCFFGSAYILLNMVTQNKPIQAVDPTTVDEY